MSKAGKGKVAASSSASASSSLASPPIGALNPPAKKAKGIKSARKTPHINKPSIKRLARRGGVKRLAGGAYDLVRIILDNQYLTVLSGTAIYANHAKRKTMTVKDVTNALDAVGVTAFGWGIQDA
jgi:histone H4